MKTRAIAVLAFFVAVVIPLSFGQQDDKAKVPAPDSSQPVHLSSANAETPPWWLSPEWWLCILGVPTLLFIGWQAKATADAADAAKLAAQAALKQTDHMVNSERAWVMAELRFEDGNGLSWGTEGDTQHTMAGVILSIKNSGSTPAWVYEQFIHLDVSPEIITSLGTYQSPNFPFIGHGKECFVSREIHPISQSDDPIGTKALVGDSGTATPENRLHAYIYGVVRYRDAFNTKRETYFGYSVKGNSRLERIPNEAYNKHT